MHIVKVTDRDPLRKVKGFLGYCNITLNQDSYRSYIIFILLSRLSLISYIFRDLCLLTILFNFVVSSLSLSSWLRSAFFENMQESCACESLYYKKFFFFFWWGGSEPPYRSHTHTKHLAEI